MGFKVWKFYIFFKRPSECREDFQTKPHHVNIWWMLLIRAASGWYYAYREGNHWITQHECQTYHVASLCESPRRTSNAVLSSPQFCPEYPYPARTTTREAILTSWTESPPVTGDPGEAWNYGIWKAGWCHVAETSSKSARLPPPAWEFWWILRLLWSGCKKKKKTSRFCVSNSSR